MCVRVCVYVCLSVAGKRMGYVGGGVGVSKSGVLPAVSPVKAVEP